MRWRFRWRTSMGAWSFCPSGATIGPRRKTRFGGRPPYELGGHVGGRQASAVVARRRAPRSRGLRLPRRLRRPKADRLRGRVAGADILSGNRAGFPAWADLGFLRQASRWSLLRRNAHRHAALIAADAQP